MAEKATVEYQAVIAGDKMIAQTTIEAEDCISIGQHHLCDDLILIDGDIKAIYVHRSCLVSIVIDKTE